MQYVKRYIQKILNEEVRACKEQKQLCKMINCIFESEDIRIDEEKVDKYFSYQKYFPYELFDWEKFCFILHCCTYTANGLPRFPDLMIYVGRGAGKNGYTSFEDFAMLSPTNGIKGYNIQAFAAAEDNAKTSFMELHDDVMEANKAKMKAHFKWTMEKITCTRTNSVLTYHTSRAQTKDGGRPGKINLDEVHVFENMDLISVATGGLGKRPDPRILITSTDGYVRDGPLDGYKDKGRRILNGEIEDNGFLPFMCCVSLPECKDPQNWIMANPSLDSFPALMAEMQKEFADYITDPITYSAFATKRLNCPDGDSENTVTSWVNIQACCRGMMPSEIDEIKKHPCVFGLDFSAADDFIAAGILTLIDDTYYWETHTWICARSRSLGKMRFPYKDAIKRGEATLVNEEEIPAETVVAWLKENLRGRRCLAGAADNYRFAYVKQAIKEQLRMDGEARKKANDYGRAAGKLYFTRHTDLMKAAPRISTMLNKKQLYCGDNKIMRWYLNNVKKTQNSQGNIIYDKIEPISRKTDGAMALFAAMTIVDQLDPYNAKKKLGTVKPLGARSY